MDPNERIRALSDTGNCADVDPNIPIRRYFRSGMEMVKMASTYEEEGNLESAFILYIRFITLFVEKLRTHPNFCDYQDNDKKSVHRKVYDVFPKAERVKSLLREKYYKEQEEIIRQQKAIEDQVRAEKSRKELKEKELRDSAVQPRNSGRNDKWDSIQITKDGSWSSNRKSELDDVVYPTENLSNDPCRGSRLSGRESSVGGTKERIIPIDMSEITSPEPSVVPSRELKPVPSQSVPTVNRTTKPSSLLCPNIDEKGGKLRTVLVPEELLELFLGLAYDNTVSNVETCGILAGKLSRNRLVITHLLIPKQTGTADSCNTQHEEELFTCQDRLDVITLGWIHTHPSQTAFLSSVDLHTHCSYQLMMPEAVAIVCAPKFNETGFFTLTPNHGLSFIANCRAGDTFHPHPNEPPLFETAHHVSLDSSLKVQVVDLRQ